MDAANIKALKRILKRFGFPTAKMVGYDGVAAAWLLLQHATSDPAYQRSWLGVVRQRTERHEISPEDYALFLDRVLLAEGRKQVYGTQFKMVNGQYTLRPTVDPLHLDARRTALGLIPERDYKCLVTALYDEKAPAGDSRR